MENDGKAFTMTDKQAKKEEKCNGCIWSYNGFCTCQGLKPCTKSRKAVKV